jgi:formylmethanofuran dehydrogenase subunit E
VKLVTNSTKEFVDYYEDNVHVDWMLDLDDKLLYHVSCARDEAPHWQSKLICEVCDEKLPEHIYNQMLLRALE